MSIGHIHMNINEYNRLKKGYCLIAAKCIWEHFQLYKALNDGEYPILNLGQIHTRLLETIIPDPFIIQYVSDGYIKSQNKSKDMYREHVVPCSFFLKEVSLFFDIENEYSEEEKVSIAAQSIENYFGIAILTKNEAKLLDSHYKSTMPEKIDFINSSSTFKLSRFAVNTLTQDITLRTLRWSGFIGNKHGFDLNDAFRSKGHKFDWN